MELLLLETARMAAGTKLCDKTRQILLKMTKACYRNPRSSELTFKPFPPSAFISSFLVVSINTLRSILAQAQPTANHLLQKQVLPACKTFWKSFVWGKVLEGYTARFDPVVHNIIRAVISCLRRVSKLVVVKNLRQTSEKVLGLRVQASKWKKKDKTKEAATRNASQVLPLLCWGVLGNYNKK